ncbi:cardiolipin synthase [Wandonia haliotis]|uniref:Cardiolipin synthase n=1 Tax=Wandonia haliotis TaxID=574963 RepID=A0ABN1MNP3_9FLAO
MLLFLELLYIALTLFICTKILLDTSSSVKASAYIILVILVPVIGIIIYLSVGLNYRKNILYSKKVIRNEQQAALLYQKIKEYRETNTPLFHNEYPRYEGLTELLFKNDQSLLTQHNEVQLLINGEEKFPELIRCLKAAQSHIHLEYYIYENDTIGNQVADILIEKARQGVEVRFIYDDFGSSDIRKNIVPRLRENGVEAYPFYKIRFIFLANRLNYRNHRKVVIIDGQTAFIGGINISDKYINSTDQSKFWRDTHVKITGESVLQLQHHFIADWNFCTGKSLQINSDYFVPFNESLPGKTWVQITASGPDSKHPGILYSLLQIIHLAQKELLITTPYFIPGQEFIRALLMAALRGVKITLLVPYNSDSRVVNAVAKSHYEELLAGGIRIFRYKKGFIHSKTMVCDRELSVVGTANLDHRSFDLNFEVNALVFDQQFTQKLVDAFENDLTAADEIDYTQWKNRPYGRKVAEKFFGLISPLL